MLRLSVISSVALCIFLLTQCTESKAADLSKKADIWFGSEDGRKAMECILSWQSERGDWPKNTDTTTKVRSGERSELLGTFDNGATTGELHALARAFTTTGEARYERAFLKGFDHILAAQYANGGWPQYYPLRDGYYSHITFNDNCMVRLLEFLGEATNSENFKFLDAGRRGSATKAIERGVDCIVKCQVVINGTPTVWCAQHDEVTLAPARARSYELASLSGSESAGILKYLMRLQKPTPEVVRAIKAGAAWFESSKITGIRIERIKGERKVIRDPSAAPVWARFYELETNRPFFCDRDGVPKYSLEEIGSERRNGYAWYGNWGDSLADAFAKWPHR
jgi:PelA/Pel-15E family pectate lyase